MSKIIKLTYECDYCDGVASTSTYDMTQDNDDVIEIDLVMTASQQKLTCDACGKAYYTGDLDIASEDDL